MTEHKSNIKLDENRATLDVSLDAAGIGIWHWDWDWESNCIAWDRNMFAIYGVQDNNSKINDFDYWCQFVLEEDKKEMEKQWKQLSENKQEYLSSQFRIKRKDNDAIRYIKSNCKVQYNIYGEISCMIGANWDITELIETKYNLQKANEDLRRFAYAASHDLKEPLRKINSFGTLLKRSVKDKVNQKEIKYLNYMTDGASRMQHLVEDMLTLSRVDSAEMNIEDIDLNQIVSDIFSDYEEKIDHNGVHLSVGNLPEIRASHHLTYILFANLISNSIKYRKPGEDCYISVYNGKNNNGQTCIFVEDNGRGFDEEYADIIFEPFNRLWPKEYEGTGMGLAICKKIADKHGWTINVKSTTGKGATFSIALENKNERKY